MTTDPNVPIHLAGLLRIDPAAARPPYEQIRQGVIELIGSGKILVGARIPTVRALASDLHLAPNTVARSYRELEAGGVIETRGRLGSFIKAGPDARLAAAQNTTVEHVKSLRELGFDDAAILDMLRRALGWS
ncbi:GntR family transcriptional regulator [Gordonia polyisoprenivorans]|uniref:GntR family transcriptional regulator n=1 Tax=Gordonia polyisoprenivorans TaxID=84595 RepID=UPI001AD6D063|nr:GntR family transcriptional regulator [Gordonia polyisoprenivorans]QTI70738.1 GntR family transcriptional regulator [Gordonia polyisoprenivorans]